MNSKILSYMLMLTIVMSVACNNTGGSADKSGVEKTTEPDGKPKLKVYAFTVGDILVKDISLFNRGVDEGQSKTFTNSAYLIRHEKGDLIWDTGLPDQLAENPDGNDSQAFLMKMPKTLSSQLEEIGVSPSEIDYLAVSHEHGDHVGNVGLFTNARLILQKEEYYGMVIGKDANPDFEPFRNKEAILLEGDHDVFGDGTVVIKRAPGHTRGHQVLFLDLENYGPLVISGDLYHFRKNRELKGVPQFNVSEEKTLESMEKIEKFIAEKNATLWIQHDKEQNDTIPHSPKFID